jgi:UPF0176 protein
MKKKLYNQKDRPQLKAELAAEKFTRMTCSFYRYVNIDNPNALRDELYKEWIELNVLGRVYIAEEGINAQISIPAPKFDTFIELLNKRVYLVDMPIKHAVEEGKSFIKLAIRVKKEIVAYNVPENEYNMNQVGTHLNASEFNKALESPDTVVVDMRNYYESEVGHFHNAILPDVERSQELLPEVKSLLQNNEDKEVLLYCTGGIRCEKASSYLLHHGFKDVKQLKGGIIQYAQDVKTENIDSKFIGSNFVFDQRLEERITEDIISKCHQCGNSSDTHTDCLNQACHILFIQCEKCREKFEGCCSTECQDFAALPIEEQRVLRKDPKKVISKTRNSVSGKPRLIQK